MRLLNYKLLAYNLGEANRGEEGDREDELPGKTKATNANWNGLESGSDGEVSAVVVVVVVDDNDGGRGGVERKLCFGTTEFRWGGGRGRTVGNGKRKMQRRNERGKKLRRVASERGGKANGKVGERRRRRRMRCRSVRIFLRLLN